MVEWNYMLSALNDKSFWESRSVFITGASGFLGSWLTQRLVELGAHITVLVHDINPIIPFNSIVSDYNKIDHIVLGDLLDDKILDRLFNEYEIDTCFHLAAQAIVGMASKSPVSTFDVNIRGSWNLLEACRKNDNIDRIVIASTDKVYGDPTSLPISENNPLLASYPYDASKVCVDTLSRSYYSTYGLPVAITRCSNIYGGGDLNFSRIIPDTIRTLLKNKNPIIRSDGKAIRDYMYVSDTVDAYLQLAYNLDKTNIKGEAFNFGTNRPTSVLELVNLIVRSFKNKNLKPIVLNEDKNYIKKQYLNFDKAKKLLNWKPETSLETGIIKTIDWYSNTKNLKL